jgi:glycosyltransferase involved in cell wall biosynthesis
MTKLQVVEPMWGGHHTNYLVALMPAIRTLQHAGVLDAAVFTVTPFHLKHLEQSGHLRSIGDAVIWDENLIDVGPNPTLWQRFALFRSVREAVRRVAPDAVLCTSADYDIFPDALASVFGLNRFRSRRSAAILHYGYPSGLSTQRETAKRVLYEWAWRHCSWDHLLLVNAIVWEDLCSRKTAIDQRISLLPDPIPDAPPLNTEGARQRLGIPVDGKYVGFVGMLDRRKAVPELLGAYAGWEKRSGVRLLLAGQLDPEYRSLIEGSYGQLVRDGRIVLIDKFLSDDEVANGFAALDVCTVLQYRRVNLSANVLKAVAFAKPIIVDGYGFAAMVANRFDAGVTCDISDMRTIVKALDDALSFAARPDFGRRLRPLIEFHSFANFAAVSLGAVLGSRAAAALDPIRTWDSACDDALGVTVAGVESPSGSDVVDLSQRHSSTGWS